MKKHFQACLVLAFAGTLIAASTVVAARQMDHDMPGMQHEARPTDTQGVGVVKAIDAAKGIVTLQHEAIAAIGWPAMTMPFKLASPDLLQHVKVGDKVRFTLRVAGMAGTVTSIESTQRE